METQDFSFLLSNYIYTLLLPTLYQNLSFVTKKKNKKKKPQTIIESLKPTISFPFLLIVHIYSKSKYHIKPQDVIDSFYFMDFKSTFNLKSKIFLPPFLMIYIILIYVDFKSTLCLKSKIVPLYYLFLHMHSVSKPMPHSSCNLHHKQATYHYIICNLHHCIKFHVAIYIALFILNNFY